MDGKTSKMLDKKIKSIIKDRETFTIGDIFQKLKNDETFSSLSSISLRIYINEKIRCWYQNKKITLLDVVKKHNIPTKIWKKR